MKKLACFVMFVIVMSAFLQSCSNFEKETLFVGLANDEKEESSSSETADGTDLKEEGSSSETAIELDSQPSAIEYSNMFESLADIIQQKIDGELKKEQYLDENCTTMGMANFYLKYAEKWESIANQYYERLFDFKEDWYSLDESNTNEDFYESISRMKEIRETYRDELLDAYYMNKRSLYGTGSYVTVGMAVCEYDLAKDWAMRVLNIYQQCPLKVKKHISTNNLDLIVVNKSTIEDVSEIVYIQDVYKTTNGDYYLELYSDDGKKVFIWFSAEDWTVTSVQVKS